MVTSSTSYLNLKNELESIKFSKNMNLPAGFIKNLDSLSFFIPLSRKYQIIGLGEATHGNREFHLIRAKISQYLIEHCGFAGVIMEFPYSKSQELHEYILNGKGDLEKIILNLGYWTCATMEIKEFLVWLCEFNKNSKRKALLFGNDVDINDKIRFKPGKFRDKKMADTTLKITGSTKFVLWAHNHHVSKYEEGDFTSMGFFLDKKVKYYSIATLFYEGSLTAMAYDSEKSQWGDVKSFKLTEAEKDSLEAQLKNLNRNEFFVDIDKLPSSIKEDLKNVKARFLGAGFNPKEKTSMFQYMNFAKMFDGLIFVKKVSPSVLISEN